MLESLCQIILFSDLTVVTLLNFLVEEVVCIDACCIYHKNYLTYCMEYSSSWEANNHLVKSALFADYIGIISLGPDENTFFFSRNY
jgi:hypothetical protein